MWTHRWSAGNGGNCKDVGGSMIDSVSNMFIASLIDRRKLFCFGRFDKAYVGVDEIGFDSGIDHSTAYNRQSANITPTTTTTINDERVRFETRVERICTFMERL